MKWFKTVALILVCLILLCSCGQMNPITNPSGVTIPDGELSSDIDRANGTSLLYCGSDRLDPFAAETVINKQICTLIFEPLITVDRQFQPEYILAESVKVEGKSCIITLKDVLFTDGSAVTADDVVYSIKKAISSQQQYADMLNNVVSYSVANEKSVSITLKRHDPYFVNMLEIPIIKAESDLKKDENNIFLTAIGTGRYTFDSQKKCLIANNEFHGGTVSIKEINLINAPDSEVVDYNLKFGNVLAYYSDLQDCKVPQMAGKTETVDLNNLVYIGVNMSNKNLNNESVRYAISAALNRENICESAFHLYASPAKSVFNSAFVDVASMGVISTKTDADKVAAYMTESGYTSKNEDGLYINSKGKVLEYRLVYNEDSVFKKSAAELIKKQLETVGISVVLQPLSFEKYKSALSSGSFDLYLGEMKIPLNMDISALVLEGGAAAFGIINKPSSAQNPSVESSENLSNDTNNQTNSDFTLAETVEKLYNGEATLVDVLNSFNSELPIIPVCHRKGVTVVSSVISDKIYSTINQPFYNIENSYIS